MEAGWTKGVCLALLLKMALNYWADMDLLP